MRHDRQLLKDIISATRLIQTFTSGLTQERFLNDEVIKSAVVFQLIVIGEAVNRLDSGLKGRYPDMPWRLAIDQRNVVAHGYFALDWEIIWTTAIHSVPELQRQVEQIYKQEFPTENPGK